MSVHRAYTLAIVVGGTGLKASVLDARGKMIADRVRVDIPYPCPPKILVKTLVELVKPLPEFDRVSVGFPGYVREDTVVTAPHFGNKIWHGFDLVNALKAEFGKPVRLLNDADMQGLAVIEGKGLELVVTLGTGVGTGLFRHGELMPHLELAHHPVHKGKDYNEYLGTKSLKKKGKKKWNRRVRRVIGFCAISFIPTPSILVVETPRKSRSRWMPTSNVFPIRTASWVDSSCGNQRRRAKAR